MGEQMNFPKIFDEFAEQYKIVDEKQVYTNGTEMIPIFRVIQWLEHISAVQQKKFKKIIEGLESEIDEAWKIIHKLSKTTFDAVEVEKLTKKAKSEAYKEFAEKVKALNRDNLIIWNEQIDNILNELVGDLE